MKSFALIERQRRLLLFPVISILLTVVAAIIIFAPAYEWWTASGGDWPWIAGFAVGMWALNTINTFFGVAFIACAHRALAGETWEMSDGWRTARAKLGAIIAWSFVSTLVGLLLQALERVRGGFLVNVIARWVIGAAWSLATFFIVPVLALEGVGPVEAARRSVQVVRKRWGEGVVGATAIGGIFTIVFFSAVTFGVIGFATLTTAPYVGIPFIIAAVGVFAVGMVVNSAVGQLFRLVLYEYAATGEAMGPFQPSELNAAFRQKRGFFRRS
jgi:hypothetical protein